MNGDSLPIKKIFINHNEDFEENSLSFLWEANNPHSFSYSESLKYRIEVPARKHHFVIPFLQIPDLHVLKRHPVPKATFPFREAQYTPHHYFW